MRRKVKSGRSESGENCSRALALAGLLAAPHFRLDNRYSPTTYPISVLAETAFSPPSHSMYAVDIEDLSRLLADERNNGDESVEARVLESPLRGKGTTLFQ